MLGSRVDEHREFAALSERADPANDVAGETFGIAGLRHVGSLPTGGVGQGLQVELAVHGDDRHHGAPSTIATNVLKTRPGSTPRVAATDSP